VLDNEVSPLASSAYRNRAVRFAFEYSELSEEIHLVNAMHVYQTKVVSLNKDILINFIKEAYVKC